MLSVIEPDGAENFSIGQIIQVRELKVPISDHRRSRCGRVMADNIAYAKFRKSLLIW